MVQISRLNSNAEQVTSWIRLFTILVIVIVNTTR